MNRRHMRGRRRRRWPLHRRAVVLFAALAVLTGSCADARSGTLGPAPTAVAPAPTATAPGTAAPLPSAPTGRPATPGDTGPAPVPPAGPTDGEPTGTVTVELWFTRDGTLTPTRRTRPATPATSRLALAELATGPTTEEAATGLRTGVPAGVAVTRIDGGTATVVTPTGFAAADARLLRLRRAQVVWTLTQFPTVRRVVFTGADAVVLTRADLADLLPPIVVTEPTIGRRVSSPVTVAGTADVYEATVTVRILDAAGRILGTGFTTADCGTGCRGDYRSTVGYRLAEAGVGAVEVYQVSPRDGAPEHVIRIPVRLAAA
ncbi:Gmad2 immunoglobulin-like domain-containing protein [Micromonospora matsumotoense]|uniref:Gmad2 immunoglobulin-like domain-containing protein n=1 Tax=Micromonospora matsumotoense TaxID=121616 RepID=UPI0033CFF541